jgi:dTDP-4-amino-4,6-dideoxygalactose transaminase
MPGDEHIPLVDLRAEFALIRGEVDAAITQVIENGDFILGTSVEAFENEFATFCEADYAVGVDSGLSALELGMHALGIGPGDEVITPVHSFIASSSAISFTGARPVWVDVSPAHYNIDVASVEAAITSHTKAIMAVHLYGQPADMDPIMELSARYGLYVIEDACQAHGARYGGRRVGSFGEFGAFSFYPAKNLGAYGDAGALVTSNHDLAMKVRMMRNYGQSEKYQHVYLAWNRRLDALQAAVLRVKLRYLDAWNAARRRHSSIYDSLLATARVQRPLTAPNRDHVFHIYAVQVESRDELAVHLARHAIATGIHYPRPIHLQPAYGSHGLSSGSFPVAEGIARRILSLPMYPGLSRDRIERVAEVVTSFRPQIRQGH